MGLINSAIGNLHYEQYDLAEALVRDRKAVDFFHRAGASYNEAMTYVGIGIVSNLMGDNEGMEKEYQKAIAIYEEIGAINEILPLYEDLVVKTRLDVGDDLFAIKRDLRQYYVKYNKGEIPLQSLGLWQDIYLRAGELDSARMCGKLILKHRGFLQLIR